MRRNDRALSQEEAMDVLQKAEYGVLSIASPEGEPYGVPLNYCVISGAVYFHCASEGRKLDMLSRNNSVSFCAVGRTNVLPEEFAMKFESAIVSGKAEEVTGDEKQGALEGMIRKYSSPFFNKGLEYIRTNIERTRVYKIVIHSVTGKSRK